MSIVDKESCCEAFSSVDGCRERFALRGATAVSSKDVVLVCRLAASGVPISSLSLLDSEIGLWLALDAHGLWLALDET